MVTDMTFADDLRQQMGEQGMSSRKLARTWHPENPDQYRRYIMRYLAGTVTPTLEIRNQLADALGVEPSMLPLGETPHEALMADLLSVIHRLEAKVDRIERHVA